VPALPRLSSGKEPSENKLCGSECSMGFLARPKANGQECPSYKMSTLFSGAA